MANSTKTLPQLSSHPERLLYPNLGFNASKGPSPATGHSKSDRPREEWLATQDQEIRKGKELRCHKFMGEALRTDQWNVRFEPQFSGELDIKECLLEVQRMLLGKLAAGGNRLKGLTEPRSRSIKDFDDQIM